MSYPILRTQQRNIKNSALNWNGLRLPLGLFPFIITDVVSSWKAFKNWTLESLTERFGSQRITCMYSSNKQSASFLQQVNRRKSMSFAEFLKHAYGKDEDDNMYYLRIDAATKLFKEMSSDFFIPPLLPDYNPDASGIWIGQRPNLTPFHYDWWHSFLSQISGRKKFVLIHPLESGFLQKNWKKEARYWLESAPKIGEEKKLQSFHTCITGTLEPGEMLYIPPYWFHQIETIDYGTISMPVRFETNLDLHNEYFELNQDKSLRGLTNNPVENEDKLVDALRSNRMHFIEKEEAFLRAFKNNRNQDIDIEKVREKLDSYFAKA